ncbi:MAG TPA: hypothetical protein VHA73_10105 [Acidimicrobiales bacterium]|nr:hypothetical protein [Acidimicrobiales bacterium]
MIALVFLVILLLLALSGFVFLLGFRLGSAGWLEEMTRVRAQAIEAQRRMQDLTRQAFQAMTEELGKRRPR